MSSLYEKVTMNLTSFFLHKRLHRPAFRLKRTHSVDLVSRAVRWYLHSHFNEKESRLELQPANAIGM